MQNCIWCYNKQQGNKVAPVEADWLIEWGESQDHVYCCDPCFDEWQWNNPDWAKIGCTNTPLKELPQMRLV